MQASSYTLPPSVGQVLSHLPAYPGSFLLVTALNLALAKKLAPDVTQLLQGRKLRMCVTDAKWTFDFSWVNGRFVPCQNTAEADLTISASGQDFLLLARRQEDPDTLFFNRRLAMEGDTELGLLVKNTLDAIELPVLSLDPFKPTQVLRWLKSRLSPL